MQTERASAPPRSWARAIGEHDAAVAEFLAVVSTVPSDRWNVAPAPGKWSPAEEVLHVVLSYEVALRGVRTGAGMRSRVSPARALALRWLVLPVMLESSWFPHARAPVEVRPPGDTVPSAPDRTFDSLRMRLAQVASEVRAELPAAPPAMRFDHAYFGKLAPRVAMRMLAAHTRHHARALARRFRNVTE